MTSDCFQSAACCHDNNSQHQQLHLIRQILNNWIIMCVCWDTIRNTRQNRPPLPSWRLCLAIDMECYATGVHCSLIRQSCHFERDFDRVLLQLLDIFNTFSIPRGQLTFVSKTFELLTKRLCKVWFDITEYRPTVRDCMFTWKSEL